ncbi:MAG: Na/Pi cotransporter family protein [Acidimicrobiales bacterium]
MTVDWSDLILGLVGGLALFLLGMERVTNGLKALAGDRLRWTLAKLSSNRFAGMATGGVVTAVIQSSSVTTVLAVGFVSASLLSLTQAASLIIGANLGTTVSAQLVALDITQYSLAMLAGGSLVAAVTKRTQVAQLANTLIGLGFVFFGMSVMGDAMEPLGSYQPFLDLVSDASSPLVGLALGAMFAGLIQSSSATTGIVVVMAADGLIDLRLGIAVILGANIGTCVTAALAAIGKGREAARAAAVHILVNVIGAAAWVFFIPDLADFVEWLSPSAGTGATASPRQLANAHTVFNLVNTAVFLVFLTPLVRLARWVVPDKVSTEVEDQATAYLDKSLIETPVLALEVTRKELLRLGLKVRSMLADSLSIIITGTRAQLEALAARDDNVNSIHAAVVGYLAEVSRGPLGNTQRSELHDLLEVNNSLERLADLISVNIVEKGNQRLDDVVEISDSTSEALADLHNAALEALDTALEAVGERSVSSAEQVRDSKSEFTELEKSTRKHLAERLRAPEPGRVSAYSLEVELVETLRLVHHSCRRIARAVQRTARKDNAEMSE